MVLRPLRVPQVFPEDYIVIASRHIFVHIIGEVECLSLINRFVRTISNIGMTRVLKLKMAGYSRIDISVVKESLQIVNVQT
jgi:hypothetical protein